MRFTIEDFTNWILLNRRKRAFVNYKREDIMEELTLAVYNGTFVYHAEGKEIFGVACASKNEREHVIWVHDVLTTRKDIIKKFMERFLLVYPDYQIHGQRAGRLRVLDKPERVFERL